MAGTARPAQPPALTLDSLLARAAQPMRPPPAPPPPRRFAPAPAPRTLADLEAASSIASPLLDHPIALVLWIRVLTCTCGTVTRAPADYIHCKFAPNAHTVHYRRSEVSNIDLATLPREVRETAVSIPFCEACFAAAPPAAAPAVEGTAP